MKSFVINLISDRESGLGIFTAADRVRLALEASEISLRHFDVSEVKRPLEGVNLIHINPEGVMALMDRVPEFRYSVNLAYWNWELPHFPASWLPALEWMDGVIVPSTFTAKSLRNAGIPVRVVPYCVKEIGARSLRAELGFARNDFVFYFTFDGRSFPQRKNPRAVLEAFEVARERFPQLRLLVKSVHFDEIEPCLRVWLGTKKNAPGVLWIDGLRGVDFMDSLMASCDAYVSLHGSEGWGLPIFDAFSLGLPTILTGYSGPMDFATRENSILIDARLSPLKRGAGPYQVGAPVALVDPAEAARAMVRLASDPGLARNLGARAKRDMTALSVQAVGQRLSATLSEVVGELLAQPVFKPRAMLREEGGILAEEAADSVWSVEPGERWRLLRRGLYGVINRTLGCENRRQVVALRKLEDRLRTLRPPSS
ncbi:MAG: glycosyltransferase family 4 protein [Deltaproteobacteria bacterium]|nr:glycosyltransferase family 4 protein [Deltaproteobacteria bacterium]MBI3295347.1 glycosyltransferase family 4 protein [Deltaproteobacteria bacterium]